MIDGRFKSVQDLLIGDTVWCPHSGRGAQVAAILRSEVVSRLMVQLPGGLWITRRHPVRVKPGRGKWRRPVDLADAVLRSEQLYSILLHEGHTLLVDGVEVLGLGHNAEVFGSGYKENPCYDPFYGTDAVIQQYNLLGE